jgi:DNA-binding NarL/FixJ family response regulator
MKLPRRVTVQVVDDSPIIRKQVVEMLNEDPDIEVVGESSDVAEALLCVIRKSPDVIVLDISMPGGSGFGLLEYVKNHRLASRVIMLSNYSDASYRAQAQIYGADYFFDKSNEFEKVIEAVRTIGCEREQQAQDPSGVGRE